MKCPVCDNEAKRTGKTELVIHYVCPKCEMNFNSYPVCVVCGEDMTIDGCPGCGNEEYKYELQ